MSRKPRRAALACPQPPLRIGIDEVRHEAIAQLAHRNHTALLRAMLDVSQSKVAELAGMSETQVSRMKGAGELERICDILAACNLVLVPRSYQAIDPEHKRALEVLARMALDGAALPREQA